jgi:hypothetical protein
MAQWHSAKPPILTVSPFSNGPFHHQVTKKKTAWRVKSTPPVLVTCGLAVLLKEMLNDSLLHFKQAITTKKPTSIQTVTLQKIQVPFQFQVLHYKSLKTGKSRTSN